MIFSDRIGGDSVAFERLLERSSASLRSALSGSSTPPAADVFERAVCTHMQEAASDSDFADTIRQTNDHAFPAIVARRFFGVEVKMTKQDHWRSTGNSV
ncbi:MAG: hypothetical protein AB7L18_10760, partial [Hyphomicrobiaceae bacterium]